MTWEAFLRQLPKPERAKALEWLRHWRQFDEEWPAAQAAAEVLEGMGYSEDDAIAIAITVVEPGTPPAVPPRHDQGSAG